MKYFDASPHVSAREQTLHAATNRKPFVYEQHVQNVGIE